MVMRMTAMVSSALADRGTPAASSALVSRSEKLSAAKALPRKGNGDLDRGQEAGGLFGKIAQFFCFFVALLGQLLHFCLVYGNHSNFGTSENRVQCNQHDLHQ